MNSKPITLTANDIDRFWKYVTRGKPSECWEWNGCRDCQGYGMLFTKSNGICKSHRISWVIHNGKIPHGLGVLHDCPNGDCPWCVNPLHLWCGTIAENNQDKMDKGRFVLGDRSNLVRENHPRAKLSWKDVNKIRSDYATGDFTYKELSAISGITFQHVGAIITRRIWK